MSRWNFPWSLGIFLSYNDHRTDHHIDKKDSGIKRRIPICCTTNSTFIKEGDFTLLPYARLISHKWFKKQKMAWKGRWKRTLMAYLWIRSDLIQKVNDQLSAICNYHMNIHSLIYYASFSQWSQTSLSKKCLFDMLRREKGFYWFSYITVVIET